MSPGKVWLHVLLVEDNDDDVVEMQDVFDSSDLVRGYSHVADGEAAIAYLSVRLRSNRPSGRTS